MSQNQTPGWNQPPGGSPPPPNPPPPPNQQTGWGAPTYGGPQAKICATCGASMDAQATMCPRCGVQQAPVGYGKSRLGATFLAFLLGNFGVHRFYLGDIALGILYLVFFWTAIPGFVAWLEMFYFLTRSNEEWAQKYGGPVSQPNSLGLGCAWILALLPFIALVFAVLGLLALIA